MKSNDVTDLGAFDRSQGQAKKPWVTPSLEIIALESAQSGHTFTKNDGPGSHFNHPRS